MSYASLQDERIYSFEIFNARYILMYIRFFHDLMCTVLPTYIYRYELLLLYTNENFILHTIKKKPSRLTGPFLLNNYIFLQQNTTIFSSSQRRYSLYIFQKYMRWFCKANAPFLYKEDTKRASLRKPDAKSKQYNLV